MLGDFRVSLPEIPTPPPQIVLGIRPEHVRIAQPNDTQRIQGRVYLVEHLGMHNLISVGVHNAQAGAITLRALLPTDQNWSGDRVTLALPEQFIHWFDVQTGDALVNFNS